jgi:hypothetical protein
MPVNSDKQHLWSTDVALSVEMYNNWFMLFAPKAFQDTRAKAADDVELALRASANLTDVSPALLRKHPGILPTLRMSTCPPIAVDRLIGLAGVSPNVVKCMEDDGKLPLRMPAAELDANLEKIGNLIERMADPDIFVWLKRGTPATDAEIHRAATIVADRLCGSVANPIIRNAQEVRQLDRIATWLKARGYTEVAVRAGARFNTMQPGTYSFRLNVQVNAGTSTKAVNIPIDAVIMPKTAKPGQHPVFFEAKSAGDFTNTNKRRKEEAIKMQQLKVAMHPTPVSFNLFLCGYFDSNYLEYEAGEGIDCVWEHRIDDLAQFGL